jgi:hypothetical protein
LKETNFEKFDILKSIIKKEIKESKKIKKDLKDMKRDSVYRTISNEKTNNIELYNTSLKKYNNAFKKSAKSLLNPSYIDTNELREIGEYIKKDFRNNTKYIYEDDKYVSQNSNNYLTNNNSTKRYFALNNDSSTEGQTDKAKTSKYKRKYE